MGAIVGGRKAGETRARRVLDGKRAGTDAGAYSKEEEKNTTH